MVVSEARTRHTAKVINKTQTLMEQNQLPNSMTAQVDTVACST